MIADTHIDLYRSILESEEPRVYGKWHASALAECPRSHYYKRLGVEGTGETAPSAAKLLRFKAGHLMEEAIRPHVTKLYGEVYSNVRLETESLTGEYDNYAPEQKRLVEIKSVHDYAFIERNGTTTLKEQDGFHPNGNKKWVAKKDPFLHHQIQNHAYALLKKLKDNEDVEGIDYVYISLSGRLVVYETDINPKLTQWVIQRLKLLDEAWGTQTPPDCLCLDKDSPLYGPVYQYCDYKHGDECCSLELINNKKGVESE